LLQKVLIGRRLIPQIGFWYSLGLGTYGATNIAKLRF